MKSLLTHFNPKALGFFFVGVFILLFFVRLGYESTTWLGEAAMKKNYWFEYHSVELLTTGVKRGEVPKFVTDATYYREIDVRWEDTLHCRQKEGIKKYRTQFWPKDRGSERRETGNTLDDVTEDGDIPFWEYTEEAIDEDATECRMAWKAIGSTRHGHEKPWEGRTPWFPVNQ